MLKTILLQLPIHSRLASIEMDVLTPKKNKGKILSKDIHISTIFKETFTVITKRFSTCIILKMWHWHQLKTYWKKLLPYFDRKLLESFKCKTFSSGKLWIQKHFAKVYYIICQNCLTITKVSWNAISSLLSIYYSRLIWPLLNWWFIQPQQVISKNNY